MAHHGELLNSIIKRTTFTKEELAERLSVNRRTIYHWIDSEHLKPNIWDRVGQALNIDISEVAPQVYGPGGHLKVSNKINISNNDVDYKDKYISATERLLAMQDDLQRALMENAELKARLQAKS